MAQHKGKTESEPPSVLLDIVVVTILLAVGFILRMIGIGDVELWLDEAVTVRTAQQSLPSIVETVSVHATPPLYYFILHFWIDLFGLSETALRMLSTVFGAALAPSLYFIGTRLFGRTSGVIAAALSLAWPLGIYYSHQVRMYTMLTLLAAWALFAYWRMLETRGKSLPRQLAFVATAAALVFTHNYGLFFLVGILGAGVIVHGQTALSRRLILPFVAIALIDLLWLPILVMRTFSDSSLAEWLTPLFPGFDALGQSLALFTTGFDYPDYLSRFNSPIATARWAALGLLLAAGACAYAAVRHEQLRRAFWAMTGCTLIALGLPCLISVVASPIYLVGRYDVVAFPAFALALGVGGQAWVNAARSKRNAIILLATFFLGYAVLDVIVLEHYHDVGDTRGLSRGPAEVLVNHAQPNAMIITTGHSRATLEYYLRGKRDDFTILSYPAATGRTLGWYDWKPLLAARSDLVQEAQQLHAQAQKNRTPVYIFLNGGGKIQEINSILSREFDAQARNRIVLASYGATPGRKATPMIVQYVY